MNIDFAIKLAKGEVKPSRLNNFAGQQFKQLAKKCPDAIGLRNKTDVLELIDTLSSQQTKKVSLLGLEFKNKKLTSQTIQTFLGLVNGILSKTSSGFQNLSTTIQKNSQALLEVFENQDHSNITGRWTLEMFDRLSHFKKL